MQTLTLRERVKLQRFTRGLGPEAGPVQLDRSRIFILPTATGLLFAGVLVIMLFGSITYNNSMGHLFTFLAGSMALVSILHTYRNLAQLRFASGKAPPVFAGERAGFEILATNPGPLARFNIQLQARGELPVSLDLTARQTARVILQRGTTRRGIMQLGHCTVSTRYPLGLFRAWAYLELQAECLVYPRPGPERPLPQSLAYKPHDSGDKGRGVADFVGFRAYRPGDSLRHVFWKAAAREQALLVKQFGGDRADEVWLDWQTLAGLGTEQRLSQLCRWILDADHGRQSYGLRLPGTEIAIAGGSAHRHRCLAALAHFG